jgi:DNA-binding CsgD family transcriptional regulator
MTWWKNLSPREDEVALLVARGLSNKEVARELGISDGTVKIHMHSILQKLGTKSRYSLIIRSLHWLKDKNLKAPAVKREAEEDWGSPHWIKVKKASVRDA